MAMNYPVLAITSAGGLGKRMSVLLRHLVDINDADRQAVSSFNASYIKLCIGKNELLSTHMSACSEAVMNCFMPRIPTCSGGF